MTAEKKALQIGQHAARVSDITDVAHRGFDLDLLTLERCEECGGKCADFFGCMGDAARARQGGTAA